MWWNWIPLRFDDFALHVILEEDPTGLRNTNFAVRVWPASTGRAPEQLGWPLPEITYKSGTRWPTRASMELVGRDGKAHTLEIEPIVGIPLNVGLRLRRRPRLDARRLEGRRLGRRIGVRPQRSARSPAGARSRSSTTSRATFDGQVGWGIFEHGNIGRHEPSGFTDLGAVAP